MATFGGLRRSEGRAQGALRAELDRSATEWVRLGQAKWLVPFGRIFFDGVGEGRGFEWAGMIIGAPGAVVNRGYDRTCVGTC